MSSPLFTDDQVKIDLLRKRAYARWAALPPDVIPLTAAEPDFPVAKEIREAKEYAEGGLLQYSHGDLREVVGCKLVDRRATFRSPRPAFCSSPCPMYSSTWGWMSSMASSTHE
jgi:hypothetical protein